MVAEQKVFRFKSRQFTKRGERLFSVNCARAFSKHRKRGVASQKISSPSDSVHLPEHVQLGQRMLAGRTLQRLHTLQRMSLLSTQRDALASQRGEPPPAAGLTAELRGEPVLVVRTFTRRRRCCAHVVPIVPTYHQKPPNGADSVLERKRATTCEAQELSRVGLGWHVVGFIRNTVYLARNTFTGLDTTVTASILEVWDGLRAAAAAEVQLPEFQDDTWMQPSSTRAGTVLVLSASARQHLQQHKDHKLKTISRRSQQPVFVLDVPFPRLLDMRARTCQTCHRHAGRKLVFAPQPSDVLAALPDIVVHKTGAHRKRVRYITRRYLLFLLLALYEQFNWRGLRRRLMSVMFACATCQAFVSAKPLDPQTLGALTLSLPTAAEIKLIAMKAFSAFIQKQVDLMVDEQCLYNLSIVRGDGHYDIAARVFQYDAVEKKRKYPFSCLLAWCGTDGSLIKPFVLMPGESFQDQVEDLRPLLRRAKRLRMSSGMSSADARPTFHATDTYNKHRFLWPPVYEQIWMEQQVEAVGQSKKADVAKVRRSAVAASDGTMVTGEPMHELINLRRVLPGTGQDFADIYFDHAVAWRRQTAESCMLFGELLRVVW